MQENDKTIIELGNMLSVERFRCFNSADKVTIVYPGPILACIIYILCCIDSKVCISHSIANRQ